MTLKDFFKGVANVVQVAFPIIGRLLPIFFPEAKVPAEIISALPGLVVCAETALGDGQGEQKKNAVMQGAQIIHQTMVDVSTGGQKATWESLTPVISQVVDGMITGINAATGVKEADASTTAQG